MSPQQKYCTICKRGGHYTQDCWGLGTVSIVNAPDPIFRIVTMQFPTYKKVILPSLQFAIAQVTGQFQEVDKP